MRERYREDAARLAEICRAIEGSPFPAELARIDGPGRRSATSSSVCPTRLHGARLMLMSEIPHDRPDQLAQIQSGLMPGETIVAVYDAKGAGTGFLGLTSHRVILQDKSFVGKRVAITSIPYSRITSVSVISDKSWTGNFFSSGSIAISAGPATYEVEFRGEQKSHHVHSVILWNMGIHP